MWATCVQQPLRLPTWRRGMGFLTPCLLDPTTLASCPPLLLELAVLQAYPGALRPPSTQGPGWELQLLSIWKEGRIQESGITTVSPFKGSPGIPCSPPTPNKQLKRMGGFVPPIQLPSCFWAPVLCIISVCVFKSTSFWLLG